MGVSHSTARWLAPASFLIDFAAQNYGMLSSPNMKDIHDANLSFFSPQPFFIAGFFFPQQLVQVAWLYRLWKLDPATAEGQRELPLMVDYVPYYAVGNLCIAGTFSLYHLEVNQEIYSPTLQHGCSLGTIATLVSPKVSLPLTPSHSSIS